MTHNETSGCSMSTLCIFALISFVIIIDHRCRGEGEQNVTTESTTEAQQPTNTTDSSFSVRDFNRSSLRHIECSKRTLHTHHYNRFLPPTFNRHMLNRSQAECKEFKEEIQLPQCSLMVINKLDLLQIKKIDEEFGSVRMLMIFRQYWTDTRLRLPPEFTNDCPNTYEVNNGTASYVPDITTSHLWLPDTFIHGIEEVYKPEILMKAQTFGVNAKGRITFTMFGVFKLSCNMRLHNFPMDIQYCPMFLESWRLTEDFQTLVWSKNRPIGIQKAYSLDQFDLQVRVLDIQNVKYMTGNFSQLGVVLIFSRKLQFYILQIYFPTVLFVIISWLTFIIPPTYAQGRIILTITTMLTLAALFTLVSVHSPDTSYLKAIDIWMFVCLTFVFAAVVDCLVDIRLLFVVSQTYKEEKLGFFTPISVALVENKRVFADFFGDEHKEEESEDVAASAAPSEFFDVSSRPDITAAGSSSAGVRSIVKSGPSKQRSAAALGVTFAPEPSPSAIPTPPEAVTRQRRATLEDRLDHKAVVFEKLSLILYPLAFIVFNICYWAYYLTAAHPPEDLAGPLERGFTPEPIVMHFLDESELH
ncbi:glycine receptor subunit alpha-2-like [Amphibalanus amphitrite]|uniref:glycine receptor subunit alpha-2-like n=1 Tax=Amphibalanus amphitrite TaxID=1232801 RepID=UPI001C8FDE3B|nr:glycine receptor subunit alpha-2-like [Amphibalanus amphitrite]